MIQRLRTVSQLCTAAFARQPRYQMSDRWREREDAAENMFISQKESKPSI